MRESARSPRYADSGLLLQAATAAVGDGVALSRNLLTQDALDAGMLLRLFEIYMTETYACYAVRIDRSRKANGDIDVFIAWLIEQVGC